VVNNEAARRLQQYAVTVAQMTMLDPVDYDMRFAATEYLQSQGRDPQDLLDLDRLLQQPRIIIPSNVGWSDVYYRQNPTLPDFFTGEAIGTYRFDNSPIPGADVNLDLT